MEPFNFWPWLIESELTVEPGAPHSVELLPALRAQYRGCIADAVASVRLQAVPHGPDRARSRFVFSVTELDPTEGQLVTRQVSDIHRLTEDQGDGYDFSDHPATEFPRQVLEALFRPGRALLVGEVLGIFQAESLALLRQVSAATEDAALHKAEREANQLEQRLVQQMCFYRDWARLSAEELCRDVDLPAQAIARLKDMPPFGCHGNEHATFWDALVCEAVRDSLLRDQFEGEVSTALLDAFQALPRATQMAYWLLNGPVRWGLDPYEAWPEAPVSLEGYEMFDVGDMLRRDVGVVLGRATDEALAKE